MMTYRLALSLAFAVGAASLGAPPLGAQAAAAPTIPDTPAGRVLRAWLVAFNSGDTARLGAYYRQFEPTQNAASRIRLRQTVGGFDLLTIERSEPRHLEFTAKERAGNKATAYGLVQLSPGEPVRVTAFPLWALPANATTASIRIDRATRMRIVDSIAAKLGELYVFPDLAKRMSDSLRTRLARGAYEVESNGIAFAQRLHDELREMSRDKHLSVLYSVRPFPVPPPEPAPGTPAAKPSPEALARQRQEMDASNCGFVKAEQLDGNIGYLKFNFFAEPDVCGPTASAAMSFLAGTSALIVDLRDNGGGDPAMVAYLSSYLFGKRTHLNDIWTRKTGRTEQFHTRDTVPGRSFGGEKPVFVLTSGRTFSGAEEFAYNLKAMKRATIVGEVTGGGAHPVSAQRIDPHFMIVVPEARSINPITKTNWEGTGVEPDVNVPASEALSTAEKLIREKARP